MPEKEPPKNDDPPSRKYQAAGTTLVTTATAYLLGRVNQGAQWYLSLWNWYWIVFAVPILLLGIAWVVLPVFDMTPSKPSAKWISRIRNTILVYAIVAVILLKVANPKVFATQTAHALMDSFSDSQQTLASQSREQKIFGQWLRVSGTVDSISYGMLNAIDVELKLSTMQPDGVNQDSVSCNFQGPLGNFSSMGLNSDVTALRKGDHITVEGKIVDISSELVQLQSCRLVQ